MSPPATPWQHGQRTKPLYIAQFRRTGVAAWLDLTYPLPRDKIEAYADGSDLYRGEEGIRSTNETWSTK